MRTGIQWRDLPERFGRWNSVFKRFNLWSKKGVLQNGFKAYRPIMIQNGCLLMEVLSKRIKTVAEPQAVQMKR